MHDYTGKEITKNDFVLVVEDFRTATEDWKIEAFEEEGMILSICAMESEADNSLVVDNHIVEGFPELEEIGIEDMVEGEMAYFGEDLSAEQMVEKLKQMGFRSIVETR